MTFELGMNYWPRHRAMYMWPELDLAEVRDELQHIADIGFDVVRLFALTQDFMPRRGVADATMVGRLVDVVRVAKDAGLRVVPTLIVINMSGRIWWPPWMLDAAGRPADLYAEPCIVGALADLVAACAGALAGDTSVRAFDIANEIDDALRPASRDAGRQWTSVMADAIRRAAPGTPVRIGAHLPSLTANNHMRVDDLASVLDEEVMHAYPLYCATARSFLDPELVPFACSLTAAIAGTGRRTLMQEFGLCTAPRGESGRTFTDDFLGTPRSQYLASEDEAAAYYDAVTTRLIETSAAGAYAWCYADYDARLFGRPPLDTAVRERTFGLVRADGSEKPAVGVFRKLARRSVAEITKPTIEPHSAVQSPFLRSATNETMITADEYYQSPAANFDRLYAAWLAERV